jgi:hypothetical protein
MAENEMLGQSMLMRYEELNTRVARSIKAITMFMALIGAVAGASVLFGFWGGFTVFCVLYALAAHLELELGQ